MKKKPRIGFGVANVFVAVLLAACVFRGLPTRWIVVDGPTVVVSGLLLASGLALLARSPHAERITRVAATVALGLGLLVVLILSGTAAWLSGVYAPVGKGGAAVFGLVVALLVPYVVVLPAAELLWLGPRAASAKKT